MDIRMIGIDYERFSLEEREIFSCTKQKIINILKQIQSYRICSGCIMIATCNRTELYFSGFEENETGYESFCQALWDTGQYNESDRLHWRQLGQRVVCRDNREAVSHLLQVTAGMRSRVFGEDQIITQVKCALELAREARTTDGVLDRLFQMAVTAGKRVRTKVHLTAVKTSVVEQMLLRGKQWIEEHYADSGKQAFESMPVLVIGNGEIGRLAAARLMEQGADVTMTVRHYKTREVTIPVGCKIIDYRDRYAVVNHMAMIVSATTSPHYTLLWEEGLNEQGEQTIFCDGKERILFDMAVPRDISPQFGQLSHLTLYNIDDLGGMSVDENHNEAVREAMHILKEYEEEYEAWLQFRSYIPAIQEIGTYCAEDIFKRVEKPLKRIVNDEMARKELEQVIETAAKKVVGNMMYDMKNQLKMDEWENYMEMIQRIMRAREN